MEHDSHASQLESFTKNINLNLQVLNDTSDAYPNITAFHFFLKHPPVHANTDDKDENEEKTIAHLQSHLLHTRAMRAQGGPAQTRHECLGYDEAHMGSKLEKVENYLSNEAFSGKIEEWIESTEKVVFVEEVLVERERRSRGIGRRFVREALFGRMGLGEGIVILLQVGKVGCDGDGDGDGREEERKAERFWRKMGFRDWSESDESWLCALAQDLSFEEGEDGLVDVHS